MSDRGAGGLSCEVVKRTARLLMASLRALKGSLTSGTMTPSVCGVLVSLAATVAIWLQARKVLFKSNLHNLAGPPRVSFWKGEQRTF